MQRNDILLAGLLYLLTLPVLIGSLEKLSVLSSPPQQSDWIMQRYLDHPVASLLHIIPGSLFLMLGPMQFASILRQSAPALHRFAGKVFIASGILSAAAIIWMVFVFPAVGGLLTQVTTTLLNLAMAALLLHAWHCARNRRLPAHRASMIRAYAIGLSVSTARIFINGAEWIWGLPFEATFTVASAIGVAVNILVAEWAIGSKSAKV